MVEDGRIMEWWIDFWVDVLRLTIKQFNPSGNCHIKNYPLKNNYILVSGFK
jgi:hypothetical protein